MASTPSRNGLNVSKTRIMPDTVVRTESEDKIGLKLYNIFIKTAFND
jgi:hypothetical protein